MSERRAAAKKNIIVIGSGAAGLMAAFSAASAGASVTVLEKNEKAGKKIYITGKGRCNFTNACPAEEFFGHVVTNPRFLYSAVYAFPPEAVMRFFEESGCPVTVERGNRAFPCSDHASDIIRALQGRCERADVRFRFHASVRKIITADGSTTCGDREGACARRVVGVLMENGERVSADAVILATGGMSYPSTGSAGDGHIMAEQLGHRVTDAEPSLVPFVIGEAFCGELQGLSLKNVSLTMRAEDVKKPLFSGQGEMIFTHFGVSGPLVLSASAHYHKGMRARLFLNLKPALSFGQLDGRLIREFAANGAKAFKNSLDALFPARLVPVMAALSGIPPMMRAGEIDKKSRQAFARLIQAVPMTVMGTRGFDEAVITRGGVDVREIDPHTMASRLVSGLYFAGEIIDTDALTGGYNLQIAWSTGRLAGIGAAEQERREDNQDGGDRD